MVLTRFLSKCILPPKIFFNVFIRLVSQVFIRDAPGIAEKDENRSKSAKVTKVTEYFEIWMRALEDIGMRVSR